MRLYVEPMDAVVVDVDADEVPKAADTSAWIAAGSTMLTSWPLMLS